MNLESIKEDMFVKNYRELSLIVGDKPKSGNSKIAHMKEIERYVRLEPKGNGFYIREIYSTPLEKTNANETEYIVNIETLVLDLLAQSKNNGQLFLSKNKLFKELNMINDNYSFCYERIPKLSVFMNINETNIEEFYESAGDMLKRNIESALNKLRKQSLIYWTSAITICVIYSDTRRNQFDKTKVIELKKGRNEFNEDIYEYIPDTNTSSKEYRKATKEEIEIILSAEREILDQLECKDKQEVVVKKLWNTFRKNVKTILLDKANILFYYDSYEIIYNQDNIINAIRKLDEMQLNYIDKVKHRYILNSGIAERINNNANNRHNNAIKHLSNDNNFTEQKEETLTRRSEDNYTIDNEKLVDTLIKSDNKGIRNTVRRIKPFK